MAQSYVRGQGLAARFAPKIGPRQANGCILWLAGTTGGARGIPAMTAPEHGNSARRVAWFLAGHPFDSNTHRLVSTCKNDLCVAVEHLKRRLHRHLRPVPASYDAKMHYERRVAAFWSRVNKNGPTLPGMETPCWIWLGSRCGAKRGYGRVVRLDGSGKHTTTHRLAWVLAGHLPPGPGKVLMHACDNPPCCNPGHLSVGTQRENVQDAITKGRHIASSGKIAARIVFAELQRILLVV